MRTHGDVEPLPALRPGRCDYCKKRIPSDRFKPGMRFCSTQCRTRWWTMARNRGAQLYQMLTIWRIHRGRRGTPGAGMISRISATIDYWTMKDRENAE